MSGQLENKKGEKLFMLTCVSTNDIRPNILINTWKQCIKNLERATIEIDNSYRFAQLIHKEIDEENHKAKASMRCNRKGWGSDYFKYYSIEPIYITNWG